jgi:hypothetical protein
MGAPIPRLSGRLPLLGHLLQLRRDPIGLMQRCRDECGEVGEIALAGHPVVMLYGEAAQEAFFRAPDEELDQAAAYPFMSRSSAREWSSTRRPSSGSRRSAIVRSATRQCAAMPSRSLARPSA